MKGEPEETLTPPPDLTSPPGLSLAPPTSSSSPATPASTRTGLPIREDCWSEEASCTLVEAWGERYLELNRGNLRQQHWQLVADTVNNRHANTDNNNNNRNFNNKKFLKRSDVQCKNRIDTLKKKYKLEKARVLSSNGSYKSNWPLYDQLDALIGNTVQSKKTMVVGSQPAPVGVPYYQQQHRKMPQQQLPAMFVHPVTLREKQKRGSPTPPAGYVPPGVPRGIDESFFRRNYSAVAAAAAADDVGGGNSDSSKSSGESDRGGEGGDGFGELAKAITAFADIYERVEGARQRQMMELEKERMEFMKSLEYQRMQLFMDCQVQMEKIKRTKRDAAATASDA